ncbi:copper fist DNA binding domain-containing protein [Halteromyces radiatus]|uniref:copper fist DNA binding domain-containing protein n=1 Tax=Halteromyces radiatus TaxID=101107 RepID=UPI00221F2933|nr:copper fist DNA binding domain-containing protein [Halteromyces radiatus]KAI8093730.1 copper fist DNA binding domain-containing protein [Halteromyces radiatus]
MIVINNTKYACSACIKGHRSSQCKHTDRRLWAIRKKGRPISQCERCREQRRKNRIHQKCLCPKLLPLLMPTENSSFYKEELVKSSVMAIESMLI